MARPSDQALAVPVEPASGLAPTGFDPSRRSVHWSSVNDTWETPQDLFDRLNSEFGFEIDVCALPQNAKCSRFFSPAVDGLSQTWKGVCWMNPPYGRGIIHWMRKAYESSLAGATVVCLVPARTDTAWWHDFAMRGSIEFIRGRLVFGGQVKDAPFPSAIVVFRPSDNDRSPEGGAASVSVHEGATPKGDRHD